MHDDGLTAPMQFILRRTHCLPDRTLGRLYIGHQPFCHTLEPRRIDWATEQKIPGRTAIPEGRYRIRIRWSNKFRRPMPFLLDVPYFSGIMIHPGNTPADTQGCILVGTETPIAHPPYLVRSRPTFDSLLSLILRATDQGDPIGIEVR